LGVELIDLVKLTGAQLHPVVLQEIVHVCECVDIRGSEDSALI
jgi:hypothetical protein